MKRDYTKLKCIILSILVGLLLLAAVFADHIVPYDPYAQDLEHALLPPGGAHLLGTDRYGRDMLSRVIMGGQTTIFSSLLLVLIIMTVGTMIGVFCGYNGGKTDTVLMRISDVFLAFPGMVFAIAVAGVTGGGIINAVVALACISWPKYARIARSQVMAMKEAPFIAGSPAVRLRDMEDHQKTYAAQYCGACSGHRCPGYRHYDDGDRRPVLFGTGGSSSDRRVGIHDEQRKKHAPDVPVGDPCTGLCNIFHGHVI